jgi:hypothetical protein
MRFLASVLALALGLTLASAASAQTTFNVTNFGLTAFRINSVNNPPLTVYRGVTYTFNITAVGHPFYIKTAQVIGTGSQYTNGVTGNGTEEGTITWTVPANAPNSLFYQCGVHSAMTGTITIPPPAPAIDWRGVLLLAMLLVATGLFVLRRRARTA